MSSPAGPAPLEQSGRATLGRFSGVAQDVDSGRGGGGRKAGEMKERRKSDGEGRRRRKREWVNRAVVGSAGRRIRGIQMGKTPLCTDAAEPVAGGATADKYVSRQHHGSVAHRAEARSLRYPGRAAPRCPWHTTSCTARRTSQFLFGTRCLSSLSLSLLRFPQGSSLVPSLSVSIRFFLSFLLFLLFPLSFSPSTAPRRISLPRTSLPLSFYSGSPGGEIGPALLYRAFEYYGNVDALFSWTRGIVLPCFCHPTGSPARRKERREEPSAREISDSLLRQGR